MVVSRYIYISFIVIFHVLAGSLAFVDWVHNFAHVFLWLPAAILKFLWLYYAVGELLHFEWLAKRASSKRAGELRKP